MLECRSTQWLRRVGIAILVCLVASVLVLGFVGVATAGDNVALFYFEPAPAEVDSGETIDLEIVMQTHGGFAGEGVRDVNLTVEYNSDVLTATAIERGPYLEGDDEADIRVERTIGDEDGNATIAQEREPAGDGTTGTDAVATVTFEVDSDAPAGNTTVSMRETSATLVTDMPQATLTRDGTVVVAGGGDSLDGDDTAEGDADDSPDGVTLADDEDRGDGDDGGNDTREESTDTVGDEGADATGTDESDDPIGGFGPLLALFGLCGASWLRTRR